MSAIRQLYQLQVLDSEWEAARRRLEEIGGSLGETPELVEAREAATAADKETEKQRVRLRSLELELGSLDAQLKANQEKLYGGTVRNPKELADLQKQAGSLRGRRSELEDQQLERMIEIEQLEAELAQRRARREQVETAWREEQLALRAEQERLEADEADLDEQRQDMRLRIPRSALATYDELYGRVGGLAVSVLKRGICQACGVDVPTGVARAVERSEGLHFCPVCDRLLCAGC